MIDIASTIRAALLSRILFVIEMKITDRIFNTIQSSIELLRIYDFYKK